MQDKLNINLINYILYSKKYIIFENKIKGKEYSRNIRKPEPYQEDSDINMYKKGIITFEGEYKNGERNGKGKEYKISGYFPSLTFEGEYLNGKRNGKGKEYYYKKKLKFEGDYLNGKRWNGKRYDCDDNILYELKNGKGYVKELIGDKLIFEGNYLNGKKNGKVKEYVYGKLIFEAEYLNDKKNGKGKKYYANGKIKFEGEYLNDKPWNGKGYDLNSNIVYELHDGKGYVKEYSMEEGNIVFEGEYLNGEKNGKGKEYNSRNELEFEGEYLKGVKNGYGKEYGNRYDNLIIIFKGEYLNGERNGKGREYNSKSELEFEGEYLYNFRRKGKEYFKKRLVYDGEYLFHRKWHGKGYDENGNIIYVIKYGKGKVREYYNDYSSEYLLFEGEYLNSERNGKGKEYDFDGRLEFEGEYLDGNRSKGNEYYDDKKIYREYFNKRSSFSKLKIKFKLDYWNIILLFIILISLIELLRIKKYK